jgi:exopolyphosphatase / guanosine-5'-triphosphate,3'-diphosphate pyrophosphatase
VRGACIDIGSNTTRLLVADCDRGGLRELHQERAFTRISRGLGDGDAIPPEKVAEVAGVVARQRLRAKQLRAGEIHVVATAAIRRAGNRDELAHAIRSACGLEVRVLTGDEEARLAFIGAAGTLGATPDGPLGVVDVGGGSSEVVVGQSPDRVIWCASFALGSGDLADAFLGSDPPTAPQLEDARNHVGRKLAGLEAPRPSVALAVGGSATSLRVVAGDVLDDAAFDRALAVLMSAGSVELAGRFGLDAGRVRLLPAGLVILRAAAELLGCPLTIGRGGIREGVLLEASA